jgi:hypothetical protein
MQQRQRQHSSYATHHNRPAPLPILCFTRREVSFAPTSTPSTSDTSATPVDVTQAVAVAMKEAPALQPPSSSISSPFML